MDLLNLLTRVPGCLPELGAGAGGRRRGDFEEGSAGGAGHPGAVLPEVLPEVPGYELAALNRPRASSGRFLRRAGAPRREPRAVHRGRLRQRDACGPPGGGDSELPARSAPPDFRPGEVLTRLNRHLCASGHKNEFTTALVGSWILRPAHSVTRAPVTSAPDPGVGRKAAFRTGEGSLPLGLVPVAEYEAQEIRLSPGDLLVLMTDGLPEVKDPAGNLSVSRRWSLCFGPAIRTSPSHATGAMLESGLSFAASTPFEDDVTLLAMKRNS